MAAITQSIRVGLFFVFGLVLIWVVYETLSEASLYSKHGYEVVAPFEDLKQIKVGADVRLAGVSIGAVTEAYLKNGTAIAVLMIEPEIKIPSDSVATITTAGLLGNNYVAILAGEDKTYLKKDATIKTKATLDFNDVMEEVGGIAKKLDDFLSSFTGGMDEDTGMGKLVKNLNTLVDENADKLTKTLGNLESITEKINDGQGTLGMLVNSDTLHTQLVAAAENTSQFMADAREIVDKINSGDGALSELLNNPEMAEQVRETVANLEQFSEKINSDTSTLGRLISSDDLYVRAEAVMTKVEGAVDSIENA